MAPSQGGGGVILYLGAGVRWGDFFVIQKRVYNSAEFAIRDISYVLSMLLNNIMIDLIKGGVLRGDGGGVVAIFKAKLLQIYGKGEPNLPYYRGIMSQ